MTIKLYMIYGVLSSGRKPMFAPYGVTPEHPYDVVEAELLEGWSLGKNASGELLIVDPTGNCVPASMCIKSFGEKPAICWYSDNGRDIRIPLKWHYANNSLRELREEKGYTLKTLSEKSGLQIRAIQKIERGEVNIENITAKNLLALSEALGVSPQALFK